MSLTKPRQLTPSSLAAHASNARHAAGPRTQAGKQNSKLNALQHGERADPENFRDVMRALGEDPEEFDKLKRELEASFGPGDALWAKQIDDLARLYWRRERLERAQTGLMRRALEAVEDAEHQRQLALEGATFDDPRLIYLYMGGALEDRGVRLRKLHSLLGAIRQEVERRVFRGRQRSELQDHYEEGEGWRPARLFYLLWLFRESVQPRDEDLEKIEEATREATAVREQAGEAEYQELLRLLEEERVRAQKEIEYEEKRHEEKVAIQRDACLAPAGEQWRMLLRREETLDRAIDRKIKILLGLRKESRMAQRQKAQSVESEAGEETAGHSPSPPGDAACPAPGNGDEEAGKGSEVRVACVAREGGNGNPTGGGESHQGGESPSGALPWTGGQAGGGNGEGKTKK